MDASVRDGKYYAFESFILDPTRRVLTREGAVVALSPTLFDTLLYLVEHPGRVVSKDELMDAIWPRKIVEDANISQTIFTLRRALAAAGSAEPFIATQPGQGYRFSQAVRIVAPTAGATTTPEPAGPEPSRPAGMERWLGAHPRRAATIVAAVALVGISAAAWFWLGRTPPAAPTQKVVVLAEFQNLSSEPLFDKTFTEATRIDLFQSPFVAVLPEQKVQDTLTLMTRSKDERLTPAVAQEVCARNNGAATINGNIAQVGAKYLLTLTASDCVDGNVIAAEKAEVGGRDALLPALDGLVGRLRRKLGESAASVRSFSVPLLRARTASLEALKAYSEAQYDFSHGNPGQATALFQRATELDPDFAMAYVGLSAIYNNIHDFDLSNSDAEKAYALRYTVGERERYHIVARHDENVTKDISETIRNYKAWAASYPQDNIPWSDLSNSENWIGHYAEAIEPGRRGLALAPQNEASYVVLARAYMHAGRIDAAAAVCAQAVARGIAGEDIHGLLTEIAAARGDDAGVERELAAARGKPAERAVLIFAARYAYREGRIRRGDDLYERASALSKDQGLVDYTLPYRARELVDLGLKDRAVSLLGQIPASQDDDSDTAFAMAEIGEEARADALLRRSLRQSPQDTLNNAIFASEIRAVAALRHGRPDAAIAALAPALPYEMRAFDTPFLRGRAYLAAHDGARAAIEFHKVLDHPDIEPTSPLYPLAQLGLARAEALEHDAPASRKDYERFFTEWKNADPDMPLLRDARAEYARLPRSA
jgi:DNA-binding winged helix-turn-helix (wHTH) protein/Flp pilus assembly protein TadD